jgi:hypothetical protein
MNGYPPAATILHAVARFLREDLLPVTAGREGFQLRVSINALELIIREMALGVAAEGAERQSLQQLLGVEGSIEELRRQLCNRIGQDVSNLDSVALVRHLRRVALSQLAIDQPNYSAFQAAVESGEQSWPDGQTH